MIQECVGFVEHYVKHKNTSGKTINSFIIDDIFLSIAKDDENEAKETIEETTEEKTSKKSGKDDTQIFVIFPFENSENGLRLKHDKVVVRKKPKNVSELLELDIVGEYNYSNDERNDLRSIFEAPEKHIGLVSDNNKRIGGSQNLSSSVIYAIKIADGKDIDNSVNLKKGSITGSSFQELLAVEKNSAPLIKTRLENFKYDEAYVDLCSFGLNTVGNQLANWFYKEPANIERVSTECVGVDGAFSIIIISLIPPKDGIVDIYSKIREEYFKQKVFNNDSKMKGTCACCQKKDCLVESPQNEIAMDGKKRFLEHPTMMHPNQTKPTLICHDCAIKYAAFFGLLKKWRVKIMPLFVEPKLQTKEIRLLDENGLNRFSRIFNQIGDPDALEFYLILFTSGKLKYFDYVCNYDWKLNWTKLLYQYYDDEEHINKITRSAFERKVCASIGIDYINYFESSPKGLNNFQLYLQSLVAEKLFNFVYRNRNTFALQDIWQLSILPIEQLAFGSENDFRKSKQITPCLEIWFNRNHLLNMEGGEFMSIEELRNTAPIGNSPEKWAYCAGRAYRFLVSKQAGQKNLELESIVRAHQNQNIKDAIVKKLEQRSHALDEEELKQFRLQIAELLAFDQFGGVEFNGLKPYFYAGYVDEIGNVRRKPEGDSDE